MTAPDYWATATSELAARDAVLKTLILRFDGLALGSRGDAFSTLARSIVGQQISVRAAQSVWDRLSDRLEAVTPGSLIRFRKPALQACGLSGQKADYLKDLARKFLDGTADVGRWRGLDDETLITELTQLKGIGRWTAEMFLMFRLGRPDVLPADDYGIRKAMQRAYRRRALPKAAWMRKVAAPWRPYRTVACWYLWRSVDDAPRPA